MDMFRIILLIVIPAVLLFAALGAYDYGNAHQIFEGHAPIQMTYDSYHLNKTSQWKDRFSFREEHDYNVQKRTIAGTRENYLEVKRNKQTYLIEYQAQIDLSLIKGVQQIRQKNDNTQYPGRYFIVQYDRFVEIVYFDYKSAESDEATYEAQICLELPLQSDSNARYHIDEQGNIWIVTEAMNKLVFIQIYSCSRRTLIHEFRYALSNDNFISEISKVVKQQEGCMNVEVITYSLMRVELKVCPERAGQTIRQVGHHAASSLNYKEITVPEWQAFDGNQRSVYRQEFNKVIDHILSILSFSGSRANHTKEYTKKELINFDIVAVDEVNGYLLKLSANKSETGMVALGKYMINAKTPLFHDNPSYDPLGILETLEREQTKQAIPEFEHRYLAVGTNETKTAVYKAAYRTYPDKVQHLGLANQVIVFWPNEDLDEKDFHFIRTREGGVVTEGIKFKGTFDKMPLEYEQVFQLVDNKPQQVVPGIYEVHAAYYNLMTRLVKNKNGDDFSRVDLMNNLGGKVVISHYIQVKSGFSYVSTMLLNNEWWILEYNKNQMTSMATKYQLYVNASNPAQILNIKRSYGLVGSPQQADGEDDLATLMDEYSFKNKKGYILLNVYRCVDEYYYFEFSDSTGSDYGVARIHFKNLSNRQVKKSKKYSGAFEKQLLVDEKNMIPEKFSRKPYAVALKDVPLFAYLPQVIGKGRRNAWHHYCTKHSNKHRLQKSGKYYLFPMQFYAQGQYGCKYGLDEPYLETVFGFNMRNLITNAKFQLLDRVELRREIIYKIMYWLPIYLTFLGVLYLLNAFCSRKEAPTDGKKKN